MHKQELKREAFLLPKAKLAPQVNKPKPESVVSFVSKANLAQQLFF